MKRLLTLALLALSFITVMLLSSCTVTTPSDESAEDDSIRAVYASYVEYAEANGITPFSYQLWLDTIKGADGKNGVTPEFKLDGKDLFVSYDGGNSWKPLGTVAGADGENGITPEFMLDGKALRQFNANVWQNIRVEADMNSAKAVVKINGK